MNVLFVMADELSWWALGHMGGPAHTPNLDRLAARSMRFDAAYTPSPICVPARAAIACGRDVHEIGYWSSAEPYDGREPSWAHAVRGAGFQCTSIGKLHYRNAADDTGFGEQIAAVHVVDGLGWVQGLLRRPVCAYDSADTLARDIGPGDTGYQRFDRDVAAAAVDWLGDPARRDGPWCAFVSFLAPHFPLIAPPEDLARLDPARFERDPEPVPDHPILREIAAFFDHDTHFDRQSRGLAIACYHALCGFLDRQVWLVLDALQASGMAEDTLILFTSDHGEMLGEKGFWTKSTMYDSAARVPLLMAGPGVAPGVWAHPVSLIDIAPTICAAMGAPVGGFSGRDLRDPDPGRAVLSEYHDGGASVGITMLRWGDWKLVHYAEEYPAQLFNLRTDPREMSDLAAREPATLAEGLALLRRHLDPEAVNIHAHADQAARIAALGGRAALLTRPQFDYTPADGR